MAKYSGCLTVQQVCECECNEVWVRLCEYQVPYDEIEAITDMIREAYFQLKESYDWVNDIAKRPGGEEMLNQILKDRMKDMNARLTRALNQ